MLTYCTTYSANSKIKEIFVYFHFLMLNLNNKVKNILCHRKLLYLFKIYELPLPDGDASERGIMGRSNKIITTPK